MVDRLLFGLLTTQEAGLLRIVDLVSRNDGQVVYSDSIGTRSILFFLLDRCQIRLNIQIEGGILTPFWSL